MKFKLVAILCLMLSSLFIAGCATEKYDARAKKAKIKTIQREDCRPLYEVESIDEDLYNTKACAFVDSRGRECVQYTNYEDVVGVECDPPRDRVQAEDF